MIIDIKPIKRFNDKLYTQYYCGSNPIEFKKNIEIAKTLKWRYKTDLTIYGRFVLWIRKNHR